MPITNFPKLIIALIFIIFALAIGIFVYGNFKANNSDNYPTKPIKPIENAQTLKPTEPEPAEPAKPIEPEPAELETYKSELFVEAKWGSGKGEVGLSNPSEQGIEDAGPNYGPQSFDIDEATGHLFLLDSINSRVIEYDESGKYLQEFPIACGGTGDIKISTDNKNLFIWSNRCSAIYKYDIISKEHADSYSVISGKNPGVGISGMEFDESGNIMLELSINGYNNNEYRFYQIGRNGDEWKNNNFLGHFSKNGEYYLLNGIKKGETREKRYISVLNKNNKLQREIKIELPKNGLMYFFGLDRDNNIYLEIQYTGEGSGIEIRKYNREGKLLAILEVSELAKKNDFIWWYTRIFKKQRVSEKGDVYLMFSDIKEIKIYKYSKVE